MWLAGCASADGIANPARPQLAVTAPDEGDQVTVSVEKGIAYVEVHSESGIGSAQVELVSGDPPEKIILQLHLTGLEELKVTGDSVGLKLWVGSGENPAFSQTIRLADGEEQPIQPGSPYWMQARVVTDQPPPKIPLEQGYFEVELPGELLGSAGQVFSFQWIDFFR